MPLTGSQRKYLRGQAHSLRPVVELGKSATTPAILSAIDSALDRHELIKVRLVGTKSEKLAQGDEICSAASCELVGLIGHVGIFFRRQPDDEKRRIELPGRSVPDPSVPDPSAPGRSAS